MPGSDNQTIAELDPPGHNGPLIEVQDLSKDFGSLTAVSHVSFGVERGNLCGLVGSDGAGKTTLLRMIATLIRPTTGNIFVGGLNVIARKARVKAAIGYMPQRFGLYQDLTVGENLDFFMDIYGIAGAERTKTQGFLPGVFQPVAFYRSKSRRSIGRDETKTGVGLCACASTRGTDP